MGRSGLSYEDIKQVATALLAKGENPTVMRIREALGTGSASTIHQHLQQFHLERRRNPSELPSDVPAGLMKAVEHFWQTAVTLAHGQLQQEREVMASQVAAFTAERDQALQEVEQIKSLYQQEQQLKQHLQNALGERDQHLSDLQKRLQQAEEKHTQLQQTLATAQERLGANYLAHLNQIETLQQQHAVALQTEQSRAEKEQARLLLQIDQGRQEHRQVFQQFQKDQAQLQISLRTQIDELKHEKQALKSDLMEKIALIGELSSQVQKNLLDLQQKQQSIEVLEMKVHELGKNLDILRQAKNALEVINQALEKENWSVNTELHTLKQWLVEKTAEPKSTEESAEKNQSDSTS